MEPSLTGGGGRGGVKVGEVVVRDINQLGGGSLSGAGQEGSTGSSPGFELRKTRTFLHREEAVGGGRGGAGGVRRRGGRGVTEGAGSKVTHTRMMAFKSVLRGGHLNVFERRHRLLVFGPLTRLSDCFNPVNSRCVNAFITRQLATRLRLQNVANVQVHLLFDKNFSQQQQLAKIKTLLLIWC